MYKIIKEKLLSILIILTLSTSNLSASTITETQIHAMLSIITTFINSSTPQSIALKKVSTYASSNGSSTAPTLSDYNDTKVTKVDARILVAVNEAVASSSSSAVDTETALQALVNQVLLTAPVITLIGSSTISLGLTSTYIEDNATAIDNIDGDISANIDINSTVNTAVEGNYSVSYNVSDEDNNTAIEVNRTVSISGTADVTLPVFFGVGDDYNVTVDENQLSAIDINASDTYTIRYSIQDGNSSFFNINVATGVVTFKVEPDYESGIHVYTFNAIVSDGSTNDVSIAVTININDVDEVPPEFQSDANVTVDENIVIAIVLNATDTVSYSINGGDSDLFTIVANTGVVSFVTSPDYEALPEKYTYTFTASATDGLNSSEQTVIITLNDLNDELPLFNMDGNVTVLEEQSSAITLLATDKDINTNIVYAIKDGNFSYFDVNSSSGLVTFKVLPDYESGIIVYTFTGTASDGLNIPSELPVTINLEEVFETEVKKTGQTISYDLDGNIIDNDNVAENAKIKDDGFYKKGQIPVYSRSNTGVVTDHIRRLEWKDDILPLSKPWITNIASPTVTTGDTATTYCTLTFDGHSDWRVPTYSELESLIDYGRTSDKMFDSIFVNEDEGTYWTSTLYVDPSIKTTHTWVISAVTGTDNQLLRTTLALVMCVRNQ